MTNQEVVQNLQLAFGGEPGKVLREYLCRQSGYPAPLGLHETSSEITAWNMSRWHLVHDLLRLVDAPLPEPVRGHEPHDDFLNPETDHE